MQGGSRCEMLRNLCILYTPLIEVQKLKTSDDINGLVESIAVSHQENHESQIFLIKFTKIGELSIG